VICVTNIYVAECFGGFATFEKQLFGFRGMRQSVQELEGSDFSGKD
jgi:hypothetical protein